MSQAIQHGDTYNAANHMQDVTKYILMAQEEGLKVFQIDEITNETLFEQ